MTSRIPVTTKCIMRCDPVGLSYMKYSANVSMVSDARDPYEISRMASSNPHWVKFFSVLIFSEWKKCK